MGFDKVAEFLWKGIFFLEFLTLLFFLLGLIVFAGTLLGIFGWQVISEAYDKCAEKARKRAEARRLMRAAQRLKNFSGANPKWHTIKYWTGSEHNRPMRGAREFETSSFSVSERLENPYQPLPTDLDSLPPSYSESLPSDPDSPVWYSRDIQDYINLPYHNVQYDVNPEFDPRNPSGYQISRVYLDDQGRPLEHTKQVMCLFCQTPKFFYLKDKKSLGYHLKSFHGDGKPSWVLWIRSFGS